MMYTSQRLLIALFVLAAPLLRAQTAAEEDAFKNSTPEQRAQIQTAFMKTELGLDEAQVRLVDALNLKYAKKMQPIIQSDGNKLSRMMEAKSLMGEKDEELKSIVTEAQYKKYEAAKERMKEEMKQKLLAARQKH